MKFFVLLAVFHAATCGNINIQMPYQNPAGVTYVDSSVHAGLAAGPLAYAAVSPRPYAYAQPAPVAYHAHAVAAPVAYHAPAVAAPVAYHAPAVAYQPFTKYAAVPTVQHVPSVANVPVTRYEAHPAVIQKAVDVAKPAIKTRKFEIRRPAIQKQFYDIEERVIVRPAGSALVELDQPSSKTQRGQAVISPAAYAVPAVAAYKAVVPAVAAYHSVAAVPAVKTVLPAYARLAPFGSRFTQYGFANVAHPQLTVAQFGQQVEQQSQQNEQSEQPAQSNEQSEQQQTPYPFEQPQAPASEQAQPQQPPQQPQQDQVDDDDSVSVDNAEFAGRSAGQEMSSTTAAPADPEPSAAEPEPSMAPSAENQASARSFGSSPFGANAYDLIPQARSGPSVVPSQRDLSVDITQANQQRLIELLTARGGVTEVGLSRSGPAVSYTGDAGQVRARVISATPAPPSSEPTGERVNTRRVVVSRPIETLQEIEVQEPVTKLERIHVQQPTFIKTARQDYVRVPTSVPVYGKALTPVAHGAIAHHAVPSYSTYYG